MASRKYILFAVLTIIVLSGYTLLFNSLFLLTFRLEDEIKNTFPYHILSFHSLNQGLWVTFVCSTLGTLYRFAYDWFLNSQKQKELENKHLQSELQLIKSKLNPHLLFNTINNIDSLIESEPKKASEILNKLSDILRYVVYKNEMDVILIEEEISIIEKYIELEKIRLTNPQSVKFNLQIEKEINIPPMLFMPFIENAFKHSNLNNKEQFINISLNQKENKILFSSTNSILRKVTNTNGIGLELAKKRLNLLYPKKHSLKIEESENIFTVKLEIELT